MGIAAQRRIAVGFFDGVHIGHRAILEGADAALTFNPHPLAVVSPGRAPRLLMTLEERIGAIRAAGVDNVSVIDFTPEFSRLTAEEFVDLMLKREFARYGIVRCGGNWRFGCGGSGDWRLLRSRGIGVEKVEYARYGGEIVSSSRIRACLAAGDIPSANAMLARRYSRRLAPSPGKGVGSALGFATVNFRASLPVRPGVYAVTLDGRRAVANYGRAPTAGENAWREDVLEVHQLDGEPVITESMEVAFDFFIRPERKFASFEELRCQIELDCGRIKP